VHSLFARKPFDMGHGLNAADGECRGLVRSQN
jgi:hypothetical protein